MHINVQLNFFCPRHGHSECDAHFAHGKRVCIMVILLSPRQHLKVASAGASVPKGIAPIAAAFAKLRLLSFLCHIFAGYRTHVLFHSVELRLANHRSV